MKGDQTVRCTYGSEVQRGAEAAGMREWCNRHHGAGIEREPDCYHMLRSLGLIDRNGYATEKGPAR
jgi:hypothetical protein